MNLKIGDLKTAPLNYSQKVADGATFRTDRRCEVIVVANAPKYSVDSRQSLPAKALILSSTPAAFVSHIVGFSCLVDGEYPNFEPSAVNCYIRWVRKLKRYEERGGAPAETDGSG